MSEEGEIEEGEIDEFGRDLVDTSQPLHQVSTSETATTETRSEGITLDMLEPVSAHHGSNRISFKIKPRISTVLRARIDLARLVARKLESKSRKQSTNQARSPQTVDSSNLKSMNHQTAPNSSLLGRCGVLKPIGRQHTPNTTLAVLTAAFAEQTSVMQQQQRMALQQQARFLQQQQQQARRAAVDVAVKRIQRSHRRKQMHKVYKTYLHSRSPSQRKQQQPPAALPPPNSIRSRKRRRSDESRSTSPEKGAIKIKMFKPVSKRQKSQSRSLDPLLKSTTKSERRCSGSHSQSGNRKCSQKLIELPQKISVSQHQKADSHDSDPRLSTTTKTDAAQMKAMNSARIPETFHAKLDNDRTESTLLQKEAVSKRHQSNSKSLEPRASPDRIDLTEASSTKSESAHREQSQNRTESTPPEAVSSASKRQSVSKHNKSYSCCSDSRVKAVTSEWISEPSDGKMDNDRTDLTPPQKHAVSKQSQPNSNHSEARASTNLPDRVDLTEASSTSAKLTNRERSHNRTTSTPRETVSSVSKSHRSNSRQSSGSSIMAHRRTDTESERVSRKSKPTNVDPRLPRVSTTTNIDPSRVTLNPVPSLLNPKSTNQNYNEDRIESPQKKTEATVGVLINGSYGGFALSGLAEKEYMKRKKYKDGRKNAIQWPEDGKKDLRDDKDLIAIYHDIGSKKMSDGITNIVLEQIPLDAQRFDAWDIDEYDGLEKVRINYAKIELCRMNDDLSGLLSRIARTLHDERGRVSKQERLNSLRTLIPETLTSEQAIDPQRTIQTIMRNIEAKKGETELSFCKVQRVRHREHLVEFPAIFKGTDVDSSVNLLMTCPHINALNQIYSGWKGAGKRKRVQNPNQSFACRLKVEKLARGWKVETANASVKLSTNALVLCRLNLSRDQVIDIRPIVVSGRISNISAKKDVFVFSVVKLVVEKERLGTWEIVSFKLSNESSDYIVDDQATAMLSAKDSGFLPVNHKVTFNLKLNNSLHRNKNKQVPVQAYNLRAV